MAVYHAESLLFGPLAERPALSDPTIYSASGIALFLATDTAQLYETSGSAWTLLGALSLPGATSDGNNGLTIQQGLQAGDGKAAVAPSIMVFQGAVTVLDTPGNSVDGDPVFTVSQSAVSPAGSTPLSALEVRRSGDISAQDYVQPMVLVQDFSASLQPSLQVNKGATTIFELTAQKSITGALSTVTDTNAKAVLTSIITALTGIKVATDDTT